VQHLRAGAHGMIRPQGPPDTRLVVWRNPRVPRSGGSAGYLPRLQPGEAQAAGCSGRQPAVHEALRLLRRTAGAHGDDTVYGPGAEARLAHGITG